jgi:glutathione gamma-glutamylcysteinyltransferase
MMKKSGLALAVAAHQRRMQRVIVAKVRPERLLPTMTTMTMTTVHQHRHHASLASAAAAATLCRTCPFKTKNDEEDEEEYQRQQPQEVSMFPAADSVSGSATTTNSQEEPRSPIVVSTPTIPPEEQEQHMIKPPQQPPPAISSPMHAAAATTTTLSYSVRRRILNAHYTTALASDNGHQRLIRSLTQNTARPYIPLTQHAVNQSEPAHCGLTTAVVVLNTLQCDPVFRWRSGWRYWHETILLQHCPCITPHLVETNGITMDEFHRILSCQNVYSVMKRPRRQNGDDDDDDDDDYDDGENGLEDFRRDVIAVCSQTIKIDHPEQGIANSDDGEKDAQAMPILVVNFARSALGQTGDGHFSPLAAYDQITDSVLVLDVARFKYPYYWVTISHLYDAMIPIDAATGQSRGWFRLSRRQRETASSSSSNSTTATSHGPPLLLSEEQRPIHAAPLAERDPHPCPIQPIKVNYCRNNINSSSINGHHKE